MHENIITIKTMREIKFRAWCPKVKKICKATELYSDGTFFAARYYKDGGGNNEAKGVLMQYTGLKDKNGTEIYEGDIVRGESWGSTVYQVGFNRGGFCFYNDAKNDYPNDCKYLEKFEVIGNIYENPELLT